MTVGELIAELGKYPHHLLVITDNGDMGLIDVSSSELMTVVKVDDPHYDYYDALEGEEPNAVWVG